MSHLIDEIRKHAILIATNRYHIQQLVRQEFDSALGDNNPNTEQNVTRLTMLGNIDKLCRVIKNRGEEIEVCLDIIKDIEKEAEDEVAKPVEGLDTRQATKPR
jgi:hypothetical protein